MYVCRVHTKRQVIIKMCKFNMFITAVCVLFLIKLRWPKNKSIYDTKCSHTLRRCNYNINNFKKNKCYKVHYAKTRAKIFWKRCSTKKVFRTNLHAYIYTTTWNNCTSTKNAYCSFRFLSHPAYLEAPGSTGSPLWWRSYYFSRPVSVKSDKAF